MLLSANISEMMATSLTEQPVMVLLVEVEEEFDEESEDEWTKTEEFPDVVVFPDGLSVVFELEEELLQFFPFLHFFSDFFPFLPC